MPTKGTGSGKKKEAEVEVIEERCGAWCFLLTSVGGTLPTCNLAKEHEDEHQTQISVFVEPKSEFTIIWRLIDE